MRRKFYLLVLVLAVLAPAMMTAAQDDNLLKDGSFEGSYTGRGRGDFNFPVDWQVWFADSPRTEVWMNLQPTAFPHGGPDPDPHTGRQAINMTKDYATFTVAVYQQVSVPEGQNVEGKMWGFLRTCDLPEDADKCESNDESGAFMRIGIDPNGGTSPLDSDIVWSGEMRPHNRWDDIGVSATSTAGTVTVFLYVTQREPSDLNRAYFDDAELKLGGGGGAAPGAEPPRPTAPPFVDFVSPQDERDDGSIVHEVQAGDTIDSIAVAYGVTRSDILSLNNISDPRIIQVGQELMIRPPTRDEADEDSADEGEDTADDAQGDEADAAQDEGGEGDEADAAQDEGGEGDEADAAQDEGGEGDEADAAQDDAEDAASDEGGEDAGDAGDGERQVVAPADENGDDADSSGENADDNTADESSADTAAQPAQVASAPTAPVVSVASGEVMPAVDPASSLAVICVTLFDDANQNRIQEDGEALLPGGDIRLTTGDSEAGLYTTDGASEPHCFTDLAGGTYVAAASAPSGYGLTTPDQLRVQAQPGTTLNLAFGAAQGVVPMQPPAPDNRPLVEAAPPDAPQTVGNPITDNLGLIIFGVAGVVLVIGLGATLLLRRR